MYEVEICENQTIVKTSGYLDSGNVLCDPSTNSPIVVINYKLFNQLFKNITPIDVLKNNTRHLKNAHYIEVSTVSANSKMLVFCVDKLILGLPDGKKEISDAILGLTKNSFKHINCDLLLNPKLI